MKSFFRTLLSLSVAHWLTSVGVVLTTASAVVFLVLVFEQSANPYIGIIVFLIVPILFVLDLLLIPTELFLASRKTGDFRNVLGRAPSDGHRAARLAWTFAF